MFDPEKFSLEKAYRYEIDKFKELYLWIKRAMPRKFFREIDEKNLTFLLQNLINFQIQGYFSLIQTKNVAIVLCRENPMADLQILEKFSEQGIRYYRSYCSNSPPPVEGLTNNLRIAFLHLTEGESQKEILPKDKAEKITTLIKKANPEISSHEIKGILQGMHTKFLLSMSEERLLLALNLYFKTKVDDACQIEVKKVEDYKKTESPSLKVLFASKNIPKRNFLYRVVQTVQRHSLQLTRFTSTHICPYTKDDTLIMSFGIDALEGKPAWENPSLEEFCLELRSLRLFDEEDLFEKTFVKPRLTSGHQAHFFRAACHFIHQGLTSVDPNRFSLEQIEKDLCKHPHLSLLLLNAFETKFHPSYKHRDFEEIKAQFLSSLQSLDTGQPFHDERKKCVLKVGIDFVSYCLKTNFYQKAKNAIGFRMDPEYLVQEPVKNPEIFPEIPYGIFFVIGRHFIGFHIRFKDLARGGIRTVLSKELDQLTIERNQAFTECYNLALTQQKKNKDIPEGGAKGVILLEPFNYVKGDKTLYEQELNRKNLPEEEKEKKLDDYLESMKLEFFYSSQKAYITTLLSLVNCKEDGSLQEPLIIDYWKKPEYLYFGPDENMHNCMISWIADYSSFIGYRPGRSLITSKPEVGINHKEFGVTSYGVNAYMHQSLLFLGIDPTKEPFTIKMSGGPDGDVAGNQLKNLYKYYKNTAKVVAITDASGTIYDPQGLDLATLYHLFKEGKAIRCYPPDLLHEQGFLLDLHTFKEEKTYLKKTLLYRKKKDQLLEEYIPGNQTHSLFKTNVHKAKADIFIPAGGRPQTLNQHNYTEFLDEENHPTAKAIVEGANLYLTPKAREIYQNLGVVILKDSSCNKGGVIASSMEVISALTLEKQIFLDNKTLIVNEILSCIKESCIKEASLIFRSYQETKEPFTHISDKISKKINTYKYELLDYLSSKPLPKEQNHPLNQALLLHCLPYIRSSHTKEIFEKIPDHHKKAIIAVYLASRLVYEKGLLWHPTLVDILEQLAKKFT